MLIDQTHRYILNVWYNMLKGVTMYIISICFVGVCECCGGTGTYDEGYGPETCSACSGTGKDTS